MCGNRLLISTISMITRLILRSELLRCLGQRNWIFTKLKPHIYIVRSIKCRSNSEQDVLSSLDLETMVSRGQTWEVTISKLTGHHLGHLSTIWVSKSLNNFKKWYGRLFHIWLQDQVAHWNWSLWRPGSCLAKFQSNEDTNIVHRDRDGL